MRVNNHRAALAALSIVLGSGAGVSADTKDVQLECGLTHSGVTFSVGTSNVDSGGTNTVTEGLPFDAGTSQEAVCEWLVPADFDYTSDTEPSVYFVGWSIDCAECTDLGSGCDITKKVRFRISSRVLRTGYSVTPSWGAEDVDDISFSSTHSCPAPCDGLDGCYLRKVASNVEADANDDSGDWLPGDLVLIRIQRDVSVTNNLAADYFVPAMMLTYPFYTP